MDAKTEAWMDGMTDDEKEAMGEKFGKAFDELPDDLIAACRRNADVFFLVGATVGYRIAMEDIKISMEDTERLRWLERQGGGALVNDDAGRWAFASDGFQNCPDKNPTEIYTTHFVEKHAWNDTVREAIDAAIQYDKQ